MKCSFCQHRHVRPRRENNEPFLACGCGCPIAERDWDATRHRERYQLSRTRSPISQQRYETVTTCPGCVNGLTLGRKPRKCTECKNGFKIVLAVPPELQA